MTGPQNMDMKDHKVTKKIIDLALEIIYLLTGENYMVVKKTAGDHVIPSSHHMSGGWGRTQIPMMELTPPSWILEENNGKKILKVTNRIIELVTQEAFPMEEQKCLEGHCNPFNKTMVALTSLGGSSNPSERRPPTQEEHSTSHHESAAPVDIKVEVKDEAEDANMSGQEISPQVSTELKDIRGTLRDIKAEEEQVGHLSMKGEDLFLQIRPDGQYQRYTPDRTEDDPAVMSSEESFVNPACDGSHSSADHTKDERGFSEHGLHVFQAEKTFSHTQGGTFTLLQGSHTWGKPYSCSKCGKAFTRKTSLSMHERVHLSVKPFPCSVCGKGFAQKSLVDRHEKVHSGEKPFSCSLCGKSFRQKSHFARHARIHMGLKPFSCADCGKCFTQKGDLLSHQRTHTGEKPFSCSECGACFSWKVQLIRHRVVHWPRKHFS